MEEEWRDIEGYEGYYQVSNLGRVKSLDRIITYKDNRKFLKKGNVMTQTKDKEGYLTIGLSMNGKQKTFKVHRLVAMSFIPNGEKLPQVNHLNSLVYDNKVENLQWCSNKMNCIHKTTKNFTKKIICHETGEIFNTQREVGEKLPLSERTVGRYLDGTRKTAKGYTFSYIEEREL